MDRKYWSFVIPALEPDFATASKSWKTAALPGLPFPRCTARRLHRWQPRQS